MAKFAEFLNRFLYEDGNNTATETQATPEEMANYEASVSESSGEDVVEMAKRRIADSQVEADSDELPDISNVQSVVETTGVDASHELIRNILTNFAHCDPAELEKDGIKRKDAILAAIEQVKQQAATLKQEKADDEQALAQAERDAEAACTDAISQANLASQQAIDEEKARSAAIIAQIRLDTEAATNAAKEQRDATLKSIAAQRVENESALRKSADLVAETERQGQMVIAQIVEWLNYLK